MKVSDDTPIYEEGEYCVACGAVENLGVFDDQLPICTDCYSNGKFKEWIMAETDKALEANPDYERLPNGNWKRKR